ncbi:HTH-type quorum sensing-dependent transcriptional regulator VjbR [Phaeobacter sp. CECT 5382]|uniref:helix-turn-helix transcriptional regulator n=1 Tax=Phaeobacter sp. CECT 5382 TaxID=1712645 RepID=UPI0006D95E29|nr:LuxR family transcriptional regulator [Phaeobacter sp. CECT 5382]CUH87929.1 HTH-type quorum sensing-dependent transcriptional regulator VjbR [Phaeobacter sp. CECT 5382]
MSRKFVHFIEDISSKMVSAVTPDDRWAQFGAILAKFGANAVNAAEIDVKAGAPLWFRSSLKEPILKTYLSEGHFENDIVVRHAAQDGAPLVWCPQNQLRHMSDKKQRSFGKFVLNSGYHSLVSHTMNGPISGRVRNLTFCTQHAPQEILQATNLKRIQLALNLLLPWLEWPKDQSQPQCIPIARPALSPRESEALSYLANGLMNARIARAMNITEATVAKHLNGAKLKLGAKTRTQAVAIAILEHRIQL